MGDTIPGFVVFIGGLVIAALIVSVGFFIYNNQKATSDAVVSQTNRVNIQLQEAEWTQYDGLEVTGGEVINVIKKMKDSNTYVKVVTAGDSNGTYYCAKGENGENYSNKEFSAMLKAAKTRGGTGGDGSGEAQGKYINPASMFIGEVQRDADGTIRGLTFTVKTDGTGGDSPS